MKSEGKKPFWEVILDLNNEKEQIDFKINNELRKRGWEYSSSHPGCLWLWTKEINGRPYSVPTNIAIHMEESLHG